MKLGCGNTIQTSLVVWRMERQELPMKNIETQMIEATSSTSQTAGWGRFWEDQRSLSLDDTRFLRYFFKSLSPGTTLSLSKSLPVWCYPGGCDCFGFSNQQLMHGEQNLGKYRSQRAWNCSFRESRGGLVIAISHVRLFDKRHFKKIFLFQNGNRDQSCAKHLWLFRSVASKRLSNGKPNSRMTQDTAR